MADSTINIFGSSGEAMVGADTINTILASMDSKLTSDDINIETLGDGTVDVDVKNDTYTINLNHTHEGMAKLVVCEESDLPSTLDMDTIYAQVDDAETPTEIQSLWIAGLEFVGGGGVIDDTPRLITPRDGLELDFDEQSTIQLPVRGKNLLHDLSLTVTGDFTVTDGNNAAVSTITATAANNGVVLRLTKGSNYNSGTLRIFSSEVDVTVTLLRDLPLPAGYTALNSVMVSSKILTTNINSLGSSWRMIFRISSFSNTQIAICTGGSAGGQYFGLVKPKNSNTFYVGLTPMIYFANVSTSQINEVVVSFGVDTTATIGNDTITRTATQQTNRAIDLFGCSFATPYYFNGFVYEVECLAGGKFHAFPAKRTQDNAVGLYDIENNVFYTDDFIEGE